MQERVKQVQEQILLFWNKYTSRQKTIIVCVGAGIILAFALLTFLVSRPSYMQLALIPEMEKANDIVSELEQQEIDYKKSVKDGAVVIDVNKRDFEDALLLVGGNDKYNAAMSWEEALTNNMSTTTMEKLTKNTLAMQSSLGAALKEFEGVSDAKVFINRPAEEYSIYAKRQDAKVGVSLDLDRDANITADTANAMAQFLMNSVGNTSTKEISIVTRAGDLLFGGSEGEGLGGQISSVADYTTKLQNQIGENVVRLMLKVGFDDVGIGTSHIEFNMDKVSELVEEYSAPEGREEGMLDSDYIYKNTNSSSTGGGIPGTDSNSEETDSMLETGGDVEGELTIDKHKYLPNKLTRNIDKEIGAIKADTSSLSIVATQYNVIREETLEADGSLDNMTFEDYVEANSQPQPLVLPAAAGGFTMDDYTQLVSNATGISANQITILVQSMNQFQPKEARPSPFTVYNVLMFVLAALIIAMMMFVVFKSTAPVEITEVEPELSIEELLATTRENQSLEDIEFSEKSEARKMIEKFVDEKPDAVAQLLRNWLNEDWG